MIRFEKSFVIAIDYSKKEEFAWIWHIKVRHIEVRLYTAVQLYYLVFSLKLKFVPSKNLALVAELSSDTLKQFLI